MRPVYDDFEDFDFADNPVIRRMAREQRRQERRFASRQKHWHRTRDLYGSDEFDDVSDYNDSY